MQTTVKKWGNSLGIRLPKAILEQAHLNNGSLVNLNFDNGNVIIEPNLDSKSELEIMLSKINENNLHNEIDFGKKVGNEIW